MSLLEHLIKELCLLIEWLKNLIITDTNLIKDYVKNQVLFQLWINPLQILVRMLVPVTLFTKKIARRLTLNFSLIEVEFQFTSKKVTTIGYKEKTGIVYRQIKLL